MKNLFRFFFLIFGIISLGLISCSEEELIDPSVNQEVVDEISVTTARETSGTQGYNNPNNNDCDVDHEGLRILLIGNSYTHGFTESIPNLLSNLLVYNEQDITTIRRITQSGRTLTQLFSNNNVKDAAEDGGWDFIILQEHSGVVSNTSSHQQFLNAISNYRMLFMTNSPDVKFLLYSVQPPTDYGSPDYSTLLNNIIDVHEQADGAHTNVYHSHTTEAFLNAYKGYWGYDYQDGMSDRLRPAWALHYRSDGGFLVAVSLYTSMINNKPGIPESMSFSSGSQKVSEAVPQFDALAQIGYVASLKSVYDKMLPNCDFMYPYGVYPR